MSIKVLVNSTPKNRVSVNAPAMTTVRTVSLGTKTLSSLADVDTSGADNNEVIVYDENSHKFVVKQIPVVDGGTF